MLFVGLAVFGLPCLYDYEQGVHFRGENVDFGTPPVRFAAYYGDNYDDEDFYHIDWRPGTIYAEDHIQDNDDQSNKDQEAKSGIVKALGFEKARDFKSALAIYKSLSAQRLGDPSFIQTRIEVLELALKEGEETGLSEYLLVSTPSEEGGQKPWFQVSDPFAKYLLPYLAYLQASNLYDKNLLPAAAISYEQCAQTYPHTPRAEAALIMAARCRLQDDKPVGPIDQAEKDIRALLADFPQTRFKSDAIGWLGRAALDRNDLAAAVSEYRQQIALGDGWDGALSLYLSYKGAASVVQEATANVLMFRYSPTADDAIVSVKLLQKTVASMSQSQAKAFAAALERDPDAMADYVHIRSRLTDITSSEKKNLLRMAQGCAASHPTAGLLANLAELEYGMGLIPQARAHATAGRTESPAGSDQWAHCQYLYASTDKALGCSSNAIEEYKAMIAKAPKSYLVAGAREALAFLYDRTGQLGKALDMYYTLGYDADISYLLDIKMTPAQIKGYMASHPYSVYQHEYIYTLGIRALRSGQLREAEKEFHRLSKPVLEKLSNAAGQDDNGATPPNPLLVCSKLASLNAAIARGSSGEAKAKAMYALASYYYTSDGLLFYNQPVWQGSRASMIGFYWSGNTATTHDRQLLKDHHWAHETYARALDICREILRRFPRSSVAPVAAYRGACALEHLSGFNEWWRWEDHSADLKGQAVAMMDSIYRKYPSSPFAKPAKKYGGVFAEDRKESSGNAEWKFDDGRFAGF